ncbi:MAG: hypothetical protein A3F72_04545 [Bacteroidetes bacterium RIFCSPLOWO2_12_FULL_35_15]|nr:MAG: hypothetical protein A3F72_04545 [Bacteroidetes bacterium RIFCSPLOWO2_12_FULL_35_15]
MVSIFVFLHEIKLLWPVYIFYNYVNNYKDSSAEFTLSEAEVVGMTFSIQLNYIKKFKTESF